MLRLHEYGCDIAVKRMKHSPSTREGLVALVLILPTTIGKAFQYLPGGPLNIYRVILAQFYGWSYGRSSRLFRQPPCQQIVTATTWFGTMMVYKHSPATYDSMLAFYDQDVVQYQQKASIYER